MNCNQGGFLHDETGASTAEWVLITALVIGISVMVTRIISEGAVDPVTGIGAVLSTMEVKS